MKFGILGAGLSGLSLAYFLQNCQEAATIDILEKENEPGGLCRSFPFGNIHYDVGPHIIFSKDAEVLDMMLALLGDNIHKLRRSNKVWHDGRFVKYPFENELSALSDRDKEYCLNGFLNNPYVDYAPQNMLQFFLATFGEGITNLYLRPYNEKIWKFDPAFMDTQMVERIPKPPAEDIIKSAQGTATEGYVHQLHFSYPKRGGIGSLVQAILDRLGKKTVVRTGQEVNRISRAGAQWSVRCADGGERRYDRLVSTIPLTKLAPALEPDAPAEVVQAAALLRFNSIALCLLRLKGDRLGNNFAIAIADKSVLFHRLSKLNFLFPPETGDGSTTVMAEVTYRKGDLIDQMDDRQIVDRVIADLCREGFIESREDVLAEELARFPFAYVIYDLDHRKNTGVIRRHCEEELGLFLLGRFGEFEYLNMDQVLRALDEQVRKSSRGCFPERFMKSWGQACEPW